MPKAKPPAAPAIAAPLAINGVFALRAARATPFLAAFFAARLPFLEVAARDALEPLDDRDWVERDDRDWVERDFEADFAALARLLEAWALLELGAER